MAKLKWIASAAIGIVLMALFFAIFIGTGTIAIMITAFAALGALGIIVGAMALLLFFGIFFFIASIAVGVFHLFKENPSVSNRNPKIKIKEVK